LEYNQKLKACIPEYNIKTNYVSNVTPFFSPRGRNSVFNTVAATPTKIEPVLSNIHEMLDDNDDPKKGRNLKQNATDTKGS